MKKNEVPPAPSLAAESEGAWLDAALDWLATCEAPLDAEAAAVLDAAFQPFMRRYHGRVQRRLVLRGVPEDEARDLAQDIFVGFYDQARSQGLARGAQLALNLMARGALANHRRGLRRAPESVCLPSSGLPASAADLEQALDLRELSRRFLPELPPAQQALIRRVVLDEVPAAEVARELGLPEGTMWSRLRAAVLALHKLAAPWLPSSQRRVA
ncbi:MAG: RNA polymerase sigma factor [Minicystis sp.]